VLVNGGERSLVANRAAANPFHASHLETPEAKEIIARAKVFYVTGFFLTVSVDAILALAKHSAEENKLFAINLSAPFLIQFFGEQMKTVMPYTDIVFANEAELKSLYTTGDFDSAVAAIRNDARLAVVTRSELGAMALTRDETISAPAFPVETLVDTTGAGDLFAAGFLFGATAERELRDCLRLGALAAAEVIAHVGPRPQVNLRQLAIDNGLI
jgi:sugar/nucleoside kinase (ribokinase family)